MSTPDSSAEPATCVPGSTTSGMPVATAGLELGTLFGRDDGGRDQARAVLLAEQARDAFRAMGPSGAPLLPEVDAWLAERGGGP